MGYVTDDYRNFGLNIVTAAEGNLKILQFTPQAGITYDGGMQEICRVYTENQGIADTFSVLVWEEGYGAWGAAEPREWPAGFKIWTIFRIDPKVGGPYGGGPLSPGMHNLTLATKHWE